MARVRVSVEDAMAQVKAAAVDLRILVQDVRARGLRIDLDVTELQAAENAPALRWINGLVGRLGVTVRLAKE